MEGRIAPTANLAITDVSVVGSNEQALTTVNSGEWIYIKADFTALGLPGNASYRVSFTVNGITLDSGYVTWGAGASGTQDLNIYWGTFIASPGKNVYSVDIDPDQSVAESSFADNSLSSTFTAVAPTVGNPTYTAAQIRDAYGINSIPQFGSVTADGTGQTIALVDAGNEPTIISDLNAFDQGMSLSTVAGSPTIYQQYGPAQVKVYNQQGQDITANIATSGSNGVPPEDPSGHWEGEETLDVEWSHAIAPGAKIDIIEVTDDANWPTNLLNGNKLAASLPGVSAISNSWGLTEWSGETAYDSSTFVTPSGHNGVTFLTASNDNGANVYPSPPNSPPPSVGNDGYYPATSPNVVSVGGTELTLNNDAYGSETGWSFPAPTTVDLEGGSEYSQTGTWSSASGGFGGTYSTASGGSSASASWTMPITTANTGWGTELSTTWTASPSNATNATYTIYDGSQATGTILGTVSVDQTKAPTGTLDGSTRFQELGVFFPTLTGSGTGTLTIVLNAKSANGKVVADAIGSADGWASTGGPTRFESEPSYQRPFQSTGQRVSPDISFDASENSGVDTYFQGGWNYGGFGTSLSSPCWAGLIAIVNQGRVAVGGQDLDSPTNPIQTLQALYSLPSADYHDITTGYNGFNDGTGYDDVTGLGSPIANKLVPDLVSFQIANRLVVTTQPPANITAGAGFGLSVTVEDASGDTLTNYNGTVSLALSENPVGGSLGGTLTATVVNGVATFSSLTLTVAGSGYQIEATAGGPTAATTNLFSITPAGATQLVISTQPPSIVAAGGGFGLTVNVEDAYGNLVTSDQSSVAVALLNNPHGSVLGGTLTVSAVNGVATFAGLTLNKAGTGDTLAVLRFQAAAADTNPIAIIAGAPAQLVVVQEPPTSVTAGITFGLQVAVEDAFGNLEMGGAPSIVMATLAVGSGSLQGGTAVTDAFGVATFANLVDNEAEAITLKLGSGTLKAATSNRVVVSPAIAAKLVIQIQPSSTASAGQPFGSQPVVAEEDQYGNLESGDNTTNVTASLASGTGPLLGTSTVVVSGGLARFANLADKTIETLSLRFAAGSLAGATSNLIVVNKATATIALTTSSATAIDKHAITLKAALIAPTGGVTPTGSVTFLDGSTILGSSPIDSTGHATFSTAALPLGTRAITEKYSGDPTYAPSTSATTMLYVGDLPKDDFDGDGKADIAVYDQTTATYLINNSGGSSRVQQLGIAGHVNIPVAGDFDGDGKTDLAIYDQTLGEFFILESGGGTIAQPFGNAAHTNLPIAGDFDGDGKTDLAIYDQTASTFYVLESAGATIAQPFGNATHTNIPVAGDFDGDGKTDLAIFDQTGAIFYIAYSTGGGKSRVQPLGNATHKNIPIAADYDGDGKTDLAVYDQTVAILYSLESGGGTIALGFGNPGVTNVPISGDFDGDGKTDMAIYDQTDAEYLVIESAGGSIVQLLGTKKHVNLPI